MFGKEATTRGKYSVANESDSSDSDDDSVTSTTPPLPTTDKAKKVRVRISNLNFSTTLETLLSALSRHGTPSDVSLLPPSNPSQGVVNSGRAYCTFKSGEEAGSVIKGVKMVGGRTLRIEVVEMNPGGPGRGGEYGGRSLLTNSPARNLGLKCYNCDKTGHMAKDCQEKPRVPSCNLCGLRHGGKCGFGVTCFNCYAPGHTSRECGGRRKLGPYCTGCGGVCFALHASTANSNPNSGNVEPPLNVLQRLAKKIADNAVHGSGESEQDCLSQR